MTGSVKLSRVTLNLDSGLPLYRQLAEELTKQIASGKLAVGERLPAEAELATQYGIRSSDGPSSDEFIGGRRLIERRRGSGTYVQSPREQVDLFHLAGTGKAFAGAGLTLETSIVEPVSCVLKLGAEAGSLVSRAGYTFTRVGKLEGRPVLLENMSLDGSVFPAFD
ncbi:MAG: GntR family transcriptional regulator [Polyangiaceae bacterium]